MSLENLTTIPSNLNVSAIVLNWNAGQETVRCVQTVGSWVHIQTNMWVVDNASTDDSVNVIKRACPNVHLIQNSVNLGFSGGTNRGLEAALACGNVPILLLNNDAVIAEQDVIQLLSTLENDPNLGCVGPILFDRDHPDKLLSAGGRDISRFVRTHIERIGPSPLQLVDYVPGTIILIRAEALRQVGLLDEAYFFSGEIADLCERMRQKGYRCAVDARARALHERHVRFDYVEALRTYYSVRNRFLFINKFRSRFRTTMWAVQALGMSMAAWMHRDHRRSRIIRMAVCDGVRGQFGAQNERVLRCYEHTLSSQHLAAQITR